MRTKKKLYKIQYFEKICCQMRIFHGGIEPSQNHGQPENTEERPEVQDSIKRCSKSLRQQRQIR